MTNIHILTLPLTADDDNELFAPLMSEIKEGQWLGVTVNSQRPSGVVSSLSNYVARKF